MIQNPKVETLDIIAESELDIIYQDFLARIGPEGIDRLCDPDQPDGPVLDRRVILQDHMYDMISKIIWRTLDQHPGPGETTGLYIAYQRQFHPHNMHVDVGDDADFDTRRGYSLVIPFAEDPEFATLQWRLECNSHREYLKKISELDPNTPTLSDVSKIHDVDHCRNDDGYFLGDHMEFLGEYRYRRGTVGKFSANHPHCSSNWLASGRHAYKDIVIVHTVVVKDV